MDSKCKGVCVMSGIDYLADASIFKVEELNVEKIIVDNSLPK